MTDVLAWLVPALAMALLHFLWQGALLGLLAWLALALLRNALPQARYAVSCLALLACVLLPAWHLAQAWWGAEATSIALPALALGDFAADATAVPGHPLYMLAAPPLGVVPWVVALWAAGAGLLSLRMTLGWLWVRRLCRSAQADAGGRWQACTDRLAPKLGIARKVVLRLVDDGDSPVTAGWWRPVVLLPVAVAARMPAGLVEALLAHELAHVRRHDYLINLLQGAAEALLFYHPVTWWLSRRIRIERELVADHLAAAALGEPRRLALALSELDRHARGRSPVPSPHYAPAAHGGHLMSRIQQLVRPQRRAIAGAALLPLAGLALAGAAFYAQANLATPATGAMDDDRPGYALVRGDRESYAMSGNMDDIDDIRAARRQVDGDFIWFRRDGKAWVVSDADTMARARAAWAGTDALGEQMQALNARMRPHAERMEALGARMEALGADNVFESPEARDASARMEALGERMEPLVERQMALATRMRDASEAEQPRLAREQEELARTQEALSLEMERHGATLEALAARMEAQHAPMEALGREMEQAGEPMEAIGKEMEVLGTRIEREAKVADAQVRKLIDEAYRSGRVRPAPVQQ